MILANKQVEAVPDNVLAAGVNQHSTLSWASPVGVVPKKPGGIITLFNYKKLHQSSILGQLHIAHVDGPLHRLGTGRIDFLSDLVYSFPSDGGVQRHDTSYNDLHAHVPPRVAWYATSEQRCSALIREGYERNHERAWPRLPLL